jgi:hypothetical protein
LTSGAAEANGPLHRQLDLGQVRKRALRALERRKCLLRAERREECRRHRSRALELLLKGEQHPAGRADDPRVLRVLTHRAEHLPVRCRRSERRRLVRRYRR